MEHLALRNNFWVTKKFLIAKFDCTTKVLNLGFSSVKDVQAIRLDVMETNSENNDLVINEIIPNF